MHKNKIFPNIYLIYIKNFTLFKEFSSMWQSIFTKYSSDSMILLTAYLFKTCPDYTSPWNVFVVYIRMYVRMIQWQNWMFYYIGLCFTNSPIFLAILLSIYLICSFQHRFSSSNNPRNFQHSDSSISLLFIFNFGKRIGISSLLFGLWKNKYFVLLIFSESLFKMNHWFILCNCSFAVSKR